MCHVRLISVSLKPYLTLYYTVVPRGDLYMNVFSGPMMVVRQQLPSSALLSAVTPAQGLEAMAQRVQYC